MPNFAVAIQQWDGEGSALRGDVCTFVKDILYSQKNAPLPARPLANLPLALIMKCPGRVSLFTKSAPRKMKKIKQGPYKEALDQARQKMGKPCSLAGTLKRVTRDNYTPSFYLAALDYKYDDNENIDCVLTSSTRYTFQIFSRRSDCRQRLRFCVFCWLFRLPICFPPCR